MAVPFGDNVQYFGTKPNFTRDAYETIADMKAMKDARLPLMFLALCYEDGNLYKYTKTNEVDPVTGKWRIFAGGSDSQVTVMPEPSAVYLGKILQYVGETDGNFTKGWFYVCESATDSIGTVAKLKALIALQDSVTLKLPDESTTEIPAFQNGNVYYFVVDDVIYSGSMDGDVIPFDSSTAPSYTTDESVVELSIEVTTYSWASQSVSPSGGEPASIPLARIDELFD